MYIKFLAHGKGDPSKASSYLIDEVDHLNRPRPDIQVLRGDPQTFTALAQSIQNDWIYTSGVIAWSKSDNPTDAEINEVLDSFEHHAFAGLEPNQYHFTAVLHEEDDGSKHVHFLVPRLELETGKALNIAPPGHEKYFDPLRDYFNYSKGWSRPDDPTLQRDTQTPDHIHFQDKFAVRAGLKNKSVNDIREIVGSYIEQRVEHGFIRDRKDVLGAVSELGTVTRTSDKFISLKLDGAEKAIRLKGAFYESEFNIESYFEDRVREANVTRTSRELGLISDVHKALANADYARVQELSTRRAKYNEKRYFVLREDTEEFRLDRVREPQFSRVHVSSTGAESNATTSDRAADSKYSAQDRRSDAISAEAKFTITTTDRTIDNNNREPDGVSDQADQAHQNHHNRTDSLFNLTFSFSGEVNERIKNIDESTSQLVEESKRSTAELHQRTEEVHRAAGKTEQLIESEKSENAEFGQFERVYEYVCRSSTSTFAEKISHCIEQLKHRAFSPNKNQSGTQSTFKNDTEYPISIDSRAFENFINGYNIKQRDERQRSKRKNSEIREISGNLDQVGRRLDQLNDFIQEPFFALKPKLSVDVAKDLERCSYQGLSKELLAWSTNQDGAFKSRNAEKLAYYLKCKYNALSNYLSSSGTNSESELFVIQKIIKNDERVLNYAEKRLEMRFYSDDRERVNYYTNDIKSRTEYRLEKLKNPISEVVEVRNNDANQDYDSYKPS